MTDNLTENAVCEEISMQEKSLNRREQPSARSQKCTKLPQPLISYDQQLQKKLWNKTAEFVGSSSD